MLYTNCMNKTIRAYLSEIGRAGGRSRAKRLNDAERKSGAAKAALSRWMVTRFGVAAFEELGLPGSEIVDEGLESLAEGKNDTLEALAVAEAAPRLRFLNVPVPKNASTIDNARGKLYRLIEDRDADMGHARFLAVLERLDSFCDALSVVHDRTPEVRRDRRWCV